MRANKAITFCVHLAVQDLGDFAGVVCMKINEKTTFIAEPNVKFLERARPRGFNPNGLLNSSRDKDRAATKTTKNINAHVVKVNGFVNINKSFVPLFSCLTNKAYFEYKNGNEKSTSLRRASVKIIGPAAM